MFLDERLYRMGDADLFRRLEKLAEQAHAVALEPDAGIWEFRGRRRVHTHSAAMCWAACDRMGRIAARLGLEDAAARWSRFAVALGGEIVEAAWNERRKAFTAAFGSDDLDSSVLLLAELGLVRADDPRFLSTLAAIERELSRGGYIMRYSAADDFGEPHAAFVICSFWYIDALAAAGRRGRAREHFQDLLSRRNVHGLLSEDIDPTNRRLWGNIPQTYSMAGLVISAMRLSRSWEEPWVPASS
jgi:GH15 family glucan-1,4-alpha-glucosidase